MQKLTNKQKAFIINNAISFMGKERKDVEYMEWVFSLSLEQRSWLKAFVKSLTISQASLLIKNIKNGNYGFVKNMFVNALNSF